MDDHRAGQMGFVKISFPNISQRVFETTVGASTGHRVPGGDTGENCLKRQPLSKA